VVRPPQPLHAQAERVAIPRAGAAPIDMLARGRPWQQQVRNTTLSVVEKSNSVSSQVD